MKAIHYGGATPVWKYPAVYFSSEPTLLLGAGPKQRRYTRYHQLWIMPPYVLLLHSFPPRTQLRPQPMNSNQISVAATLKEALQLSIVLGSDEFIDTFLGFDQVKKIEHRCKINALNNCELLA